MTTRNAAAYTFVGYHGYLGNQVIYLTEAISSTHPYVIQGQYKQANQPGSGNGYNIANALNVSVGQVANTTDTYWKFSEYYVGGGSNPYMEIHVPVVAGGGSQQYSNTISNPPELYEVIYQTLSLNISNAPSSNTDLEIKGEFDSGVNTTGQIPEGTTREQALVNQGIAALSSLPAQGFGIGTWSYENGMAATTGVQAYQGSALGPNGMVYQNFGAKGGGWLAALPFGGWFNNVFDPQEIVLVDIPESEWSNQPVITITSTNVVDDADTCYTCTPQTGATGSITLNAVPAVNVTGKVAVGTQPLKNWPVTLQETYNGATTNYQLSSNSAGGYSFFARLGTSYVLSTTYGSTTWQNSTTTPGTPTSKDLNLSLPVFTATPSAYPNPTQVGYNEGFQTALSGAFVFPVSYSWNFGDGTWANGTDSPYHIYIQSGDFTVVLRATDSGNPKQWSNQTLSLSVKNPCSGTQACVNPASQTVYYNKGGSCNIPTASFAGYAASTDQPPFTYGWAFGDGGTGSGQSVSHTYPLRATTWTVTLTITNATGHKTTATATVTVKYLLACQPPP